MRRDAGLLVCLQGGQTPCLKAYATQFDEIEPQKVKHCSTDVAIIKRTIPPLLVLTTDPGCLLALARKKFL